MATVAMPIAKGIMLDKWMNTGYEEEPLKPYIDPHLDLNDHGRIRKCSMRVISTLMVGWFVQ